MMNGKSIVKYNGIFGGGGIKGIAYIGALYALEQHGFIINKAGGTSVGAIIASLLVAGYRASELFNLLDKIDLTLFNQSFNLKMLNSYVKNKGMVSSNIIYRLLKPYFLSKNIWTYQDVMDGNHSKLKVTATKINGLEFSKKQKIFEEIIIPDDLPKLKINPLSFPILESVVMSSSFPGYFTPYQINNQFYIDGGIKGKINLNLFMEEPTLRLAFYLKKHPKEIVKPIKGGYLIMIDTKDINSLNFKLSENDKKSLFESGYKSALFWLYQVT